jgi:Bax protein
MLYGLAGWTGLTGRAPGTLVTAWLPPRAAVIPKPLVKPASWAVLRRVEPQRKGPVKLIRGAPIPGFEESVALIRDVDALINKFAAIGYDLGAVRENQKPVPPVYLTGLPHGLPAMSSVKQRKRAFLQSILPLILQENAIVAEQRERLKRALSAGTTMTAAQKAWVADLARAYDVERSADGTFDLDMLKRRVDTVPPSLALAQSAEESGWGRSRFAMQGNAVFGQWSWKKGSGLVPRKRDDGERHEVRIFASLRNSVAAYLRNLNTHWAYKEFRRRRAELRREGKPLTGLDLIPTLSRYSERGAKYIETLRGLISFNKLHKLDRARLATSGKRL